MRPDNNNELYNIAGSPFEGSVSAEYVRRHLLRETFCELADAFNDKETTSHPIADPTMMAKLYALSQVQRTSMGIAGFDPFSAIDTTVTTGMVNAFIAPEHDRYEVGGETFLTRAVLLDMPQKGENDHVSVFGLNYYQADFNISPSDRLSIDGVSATDVESKLVVVERGGNVLEERAPVMGQTAIFGVYNKATGDAKLYKIAHVKDIPVDASEQLARSVSGQGGSVVYDGAVSEEGIESRAFIALPDSTCMTVDMLRGTLELQANREFRLAVEAFENDVSPNASLSEAEADAITASLKGAFGESK